MHLQHQNKFLVCVKKMYLALKLVKELYFQKGKALLLLLLGRSDMLAAPEKPRAESTNALPSENIVPSMYRVRRWLCVM